MGTAVATDITERLRKQIGQGPGEVQVDAGGASIAVDVEQSERYAVGVRGITVRSGQRGDVREIADRVVEGVTELDGPLTVVEVDRGGDRAIVRSAQPDADEGGVSYWEADVRSDQTSLRRYRKEHSAPERETVTEPLMHGTVGRVAEQLADAVAGS